MPKSSPNDICVECYHTADFPPSIIHCGNDCHDPYRKPAEPPPEVPTWDSEGGRPINPNVMAAASMPEVPAPDDVWAIVYEGKMIGAYDHDSEVSGASAAARCVSGSCVVRYVRSKP